MRPPCLPPPRDDAQKFLGKRQEIGNTNSQNPITPCIEVCNMKGHVCRRIRDYSCDVIFFQQHNPGVSNLYMIDVTSNNLFIVLSNDQSQCRECGIRIRILFQVARVALSHLL